MLYRYTELVLTEARVGLKKRNVMQGRFTKTSTDCLAAQRRNLLRRVYHQTVSLTESTVHSKGVFTTGDAKASMHTLQDMAVHGKSISKPVSIKRLFSHETSKGINVAQVVNRLIYE